MAKAILVFWATATVIIHLEISSAAEIGGPLEGKSAISTEYKARFHKIHQNGVNASEGYIAGVHNMEKNADEESWPSFATKCAEVIKGIVTALTGAVSSEPGDRTDLHLDFKNRIYHHDNRKSNSTQESALPGPEDYDEPEETREYQPQYGVVPVDSIEPDQLPEAENAEEDEYRYLPDPDFNEETHRPIHFHGHLPEEGEYPGVTETSPQPTWNTPATREVMYEPTEQMTGIPRYGGFHPIGTDPVRGGEPDGTTESPLIGLPSSYPIYQTTPDFRQIIPPAETGEAPDADGPREQPPSGTPETLPPDLWKPIRDGQKDFLPEAPAGFGDGPASSRRVFATSPESQTTPARVDDAGDPEVAHLPAMTEDDDRSSRTLPESANQLSQTPATDGPFDAYDYRVNAKGEEDSSEGESEEGYPREEEEEKATPSPSDDLIPDATQTVPEIRTEFDPAAGNVPESPNPLPPYGVPESIFKMLSSTQPPPAIYIPISNSQTESMTEGPTDLDEDCCCDEDAYDEESPNHKAICKNACRDLEQARSELKAIFDRIKKKLKCSRRLSY